VEFGGIEPDQGLGADISLRSVSDREELSGFILPFGFYLEIREDRKTVKQ